MFPYQNVLEYVRIIRGSLIRKGRLQHVDEEVPPPDLADEDAYWDWYNARAETKSYLLHKALNAGGSARDLTHVGWDATITSPRVTYLKVIAAAMTMSGKTASFALTLYTTIRSDENPLNSFFTKFMLYKDDIDALGGVSMDESVHVSNGMRAIGDDERLEAIRTRLSDKLNMGELTWKVFIDELREECGEDCDDEYDEETEEEETEDEEMDEEIEEGDDEMDEEKWEPGEGGGLIRYNKVENQVDEEDGMIKLENQKDEDEEDMDEEDGVIKIEWQMDGGDRMIKIKKEMEMAIIKGEEVEMKTE